MDKKNEGMAVRITLEAIREASGGTLRPADVVASARGEDSPLHPYFTWDDGDAAERWRLQEAMALIRVHVMVVKGVADPVKTYVSLRRDRSEGSVGYRRLVDVMNDEELRAHLLADALADVRTFQRKYRNLTEMAQIIAAMEETERALVSEKIVLSQAAVIQPA